MPDREPDTAAPHRTLVVLVLLLLVAAVYGQVANYDYVEYDDPRYIKAKQVMEGLTGRGFVWSLTAWEFSNWHPLTWLRLLRHCSPHRGYHLTN